MSERVEVSMVVAVRGAKVLDASIYDVIAGHVLAADTCKHCRKESSKHWRCEGQGGTSRRSRRRSEELALAYFELFPPEVKA